MVPQSSTGAQNKQQSYIEFRLHERKSLYTQKFASRLTCLQKHLAKSKKHKKEEKRWKASFLLIKWNWVVEEERYQQLSRLECAIYSANQKKSPREEFHDWFVDDNDYESNKDI